MPSVFGYLDYRKYIKDIVSNRIASNSSYSIRAFAKNIGLSATHVNRILNGRRNISKATLPLFSTGLRLTEKEGEYFELLVTFNQTKIAQMKRSSLDQIMHFRQRNLRQVEPKQYEFYDQWYHTVIRELVTMLPYTESNYEQIAKKLVPAIKITEAQRSINLLQELDLIKIIDGKYEQSDTSITTGLHWDSSVINKFQEKLADLGTQAIARFPKDQRDISTLTVTLTEESLKRIQTLIKCVRENIIEEANAGGNRVYQINFQVFPVSELIQGNQ